MSWKPSETSFEPRDAAARQEGSSVRWTPGGVSQDAQAENPPSEYAQNFQEIGAQIATLAERVSQIERETETVGVKDAVKALHRGVSHFADRVAQMANRSDSQIAALAASGEASVRISDERFQAIEERIRILERAACTGASALDRALEELERLRTQPHIGERTLALPAQDTPCELAQKMEFVSQTEAERDSTSSAAESELPVATEATADVAEPSPDAPPVAEMETAVPRETGGVSPTQSETTAPSAGGAPDSDYLPGKIEPAGDVRDDPEEPPVVGDFPIAAAQPPPASAAAMGDVIRRSKGGFGWGFRGGKPRDGAWEWRRRAVLVTSIFGVAIAAALAGFVLSRSAVSPPPRAVAAAELRAPIERDHASLPKTLPAADGSPDTEVRAHPSTVPVLIGQPPAPGAASSKMAFAARSQTLETLAGSGSAKGDLLLGLKYLDGDGVAANDAEAARWLGRAAQQGQPLAQYRLGSLYEHGRGVPADARKAAYWYALAANQGNRKAMHNLAVAYAQGAGEPKDAVRAAMWFSRAANLGLVDSQFDLAVLYERGMGVKQSPIDAYKWYAIAAAQGDAESKARVEALGAQLGAADRAAARQAANSFRPQRLSPAANAAPAFH